MAKNIIDRTATKASKKVEAAKIKITEKARGFKGKLVYDPKSKQSSLFDFK